MMKTKLMLYQIRPPLQLQFEICFVDPFFLIETGFNQLIGYKEKRKREKEEKRKRAREGFCI